MLRKLLKYEFAATGRYLLPLLCLLLVMAAAAGLSIRILSAGQAGRAAAALAAIFVVLFFLSVMALAAVTVVLIVYRFYRNLLCSEGYLMHTLPVSVHQLICSKLIAAVCWMTVTSVLSMAACLAWPSGLRYGRRCSRSCACSLSGSAWPTALARRSS